MKRLATLAIVLLSTNLAPAQGSDECATAEVIAGQGTFAFDNTLATTDGLADPLCLTSGQSQMDHDVWFAWTAPTTGLAELTTCGLTTIDTWLAAYSGTGCPPAPPLDCNDDACPGFQSEISFGVTGGSTYLLRVGTWAGAAGGTGSLSVSMMTPAPGDDCASALPIAGEGAFAFDNSTATLDGLGDVLCTHPSGDQMARDVWFEWTSSFTGEVDVRTCGFASHDTMLAAYDLQACPPTNALNCNDDACPGYQSEISFGVTDGSTYLIRVGSWPSASGGVGQIQIAEHTGPSCVVPNVGPDIVVGNVTAVSNWGAVGATAAYSLGGSACNFGDTEMPWEANSADHPVIAQNLYRVTDGRIEQIGLSWVKHGFGAATENACCTCQDPNNGQILGVGCADTYSSSLNGQQSLGSIGGIGARSDINPVDGTFPFPYPTMGMTGNAIYKRMQVALADLDPALNVGASYFAEVHYVGPQDAQAGNGANSASYRPITVGAPASGAWDLALTGVTQRTLPGIYAWQAADPNVVIALVDVPGDGRFLVASLAEQIGATSVWHYEYAVHNLTSYRAGQSFSIPVPAGATVSNVGFKDVDRHSGEIYDSTDWTSAVLLDRVQWETSSWGANPNANALHWGTLYNFWFDANIPPQDGSAAIDLFLPGGPAEPGRVLAAARAPGPACTTANYCSVAPNSAGAGAVIASSGSTSLANNDFTLEISGAPANEFGIFYYGEMPAQTPLGDGWRCIGGTVVRLFPVLNTGPGGTASRPLDVMNLPSGAILDSGITYYFQFWHRDPAGPGGAGINLSDGLSAIFCP